MSTERNDVPIPGVGDGLTPARTAAEPTAIRPTYALEGHEDEVYHELRLPERGTEPEYCALLNQSWTFNRAMRWADTGNGTVLAYAEGGCLALTGDNRVSDWFSDPVNRLTHTGVELRFEKVSARQREAIVLPGFQVQLDQHPRLVVDVAVATSAWQVCVLVKGRSGPPLLASEWRAGAGTVTLDVATAWREKGYTLRFAELHIALGLWTDAPETAAAVTFTARLPGESALVPCLPVVRTQSLAEQKGVPLTVAILSADGQVPDPATVQVTARVNGEVTSMRATGALWTAELANLPLGEHRVELEATGVVTLRNAVTVRVTDGDFVSYRSDQRSLVRAGRALGPTSGSYQGLVLVRDVGTPSEKLVQGQAAWDAWDRAAPPGEHWHYWEALTEAELDERFAYLEHCGWDLLHISQGWGLWEKLDACGHIAPHGAEQLALLLRVAARHGLVLLQALSHYGYGKSHTPVLRQYLEAGFQDGDWPNPDAGSRFNALFHGYLQDYATLFREETALFAMSTSGEGDIAAGPVRVNDTMRWMQTHMPNHIFLAEPIFQLIDLPDAHRRRLLINASTEGMQADIAWEPQLAGSRMYGMGKYLFAETDLAIEFKFLQLGDYFMGEGSWPCPPLYARFMKHTSESWAGTENYRRRVRDSLYLGLMHRNPILLTWEEQQTEDERIVLRQARELIDWSQPFQDAPVGIRVDSANVGVRSWPNTLLPGSWGVEGRLVLSRYEEYFSALPLATRYLQRDEPAPAGMAVIDARKPYEEPVLPADLLAESPLRVSAGYRASYLWSADRRTLLAYVYNCTAHDFLDGRNDLSGKWHRIPSPAACQVTLQNLPADGLLCRVFSLNEKACIRSVEVDGAITMTLPCSADDYMIVVTRRGDT